MLNAESIVTNYLIELFKEDSLVNTVIYGIPSDRDLNKSNIFPLVHIMIPTVNFDGNSIDFQFDVACVDLRDIRDNSNSDKVFGDNLIDSLNTATAVFGKALLKLELGNNDYNIHLLEHTSLDPVVFSEKNILDGRQLSITLSIENSISIC